MALSNAAIRAIAIRRKQARANAPQAANDQAPTSKMHPRLLAMCVDAGGFDQNAAYDG